MATNTTTKSLSFRAVPGIRGTDGYDVIADGKEIGYVHRLRKGCVANSDGRARRGWSNVRDDVDYPTRKAAAAALLAA